MYELVKKLYPVNRSLTGEGNRETLKELQKAIPIEIKEISSGTKVFDWEIPDEWNISDGYIRKEDGTKIADFRKSNLYVVNYSAPINAIVDLDELKKHLHTIPECPDFIPYKTSYYDRNWGFCLPYNEYVNLIEGLYKVCIDSTLKEGSLSYGELYLQGKFDDEIIISTHICHPSMCNDNLSGIAVASHLAKYVNSLKNRQFSYRFLFIPGTIGSIAWLALNEDKIKNIAFGLVLTGLGDGSGFTYKKTKQGNTEIDMIFEYVLKKSNTSHKVIDFYPYGYDERQFSSPGFNLPFASLMRKVHGTYPEYHTSADNLDFITHESLNSSYEICRDAINLFEKNNFYISLLPYGEPRLGKRGVYKAMNDVGKNIKELQLAMLWVLSYSDGRTSLENIGIKSCIRYETLAQAAKILSERKIIYHKQAGYTKMHIQIDNFKKLQNRKILVTGAKGFLGWHLCCYLMQLGAEVYGIGRSLNSIEGLNVTEYHMADCSDIVGLGKVFNKIRPEIVFHLAGKADGRRDINLVLPSFSGDLASTVNVLTLSAEYACNKIVIAGSLEEPDHKMNNPRASSPYAAAKWAGTVYARMFFDLYKTPVTIARIFMTYGPGQRESKLIPYVINSFLNNSPPKITSLERAVDWIYVDDTIRGLASLIFPESINGEIIDIGSGALVTIRQIVKHISKIIGDGVDTRFGSAEPRYNEQVRVADIKKTYLLTRWKPQISLLSGLEKTVKWHKKHTVVP